MQIRRRKAIEIRRASGLGLTEKPMVVLVNQVTSGAGQILARALLDSGLALVIWQRTFGAGLIQTIRALADDSAILVKTGEYLSPSGRSLRIKEFSPMLMLLL